MVPLGTGECDRVRLGKASCAWSAGHRRDRTHFPVPTKVCVHSHPRTQEPALRNTRHAADSHACSLQPCSHRCFTSSTARRKAQHSAHVSTCLHAALARKQSRRCVRLISEAFTSFVCAVRSVRDGLNSTSSVAPSSQAVNAQDAVFTIFHVLSVENPSWVFYTCCGGYSSDRKLGNATNVSSTACLHTGW